MDNPLKGKTILLGVCGGIAAYKAVEILRLLTRAGAGVRVVMTRAAQEFVGETTFRVLSENEVCTGLFNTNETSVRHIEWAREADALVIAPATANILGKMANGLADDALSTMLLAVTSKKMVCPSMNSAMYESLAVQRNLDILEKDGVFILEPGSGELACKTTGTGRLPDPEFIVDRLAKLLTPGDLKGKRLLVTAGPTREAIDPVRYISNHSSGKMGYALAEAAEKRGGEVTLVSGPVNLSPPAGVEFLPVTSAREMKDTVMAGMEDARIIIKVAAVADYRPASPKKSKIKKKDQVRNQSPVSDQSSDLVSGQVSDSGQTQNQDQDAGQARSTLSLSLMENPDILKALGKKKQDRFLVGFAAETDDLEANALLKMEKKNLDMIVGNIVGVEGSGFGSDTNRITMFFRDGSREICDSMTKTKAAHLILDRILERLS